MSQLADAPFDPASVPVRPASTVMLVRDGDGGLEVFMLQRNLTASFVAGAHVFPGGAVDPADADAETAAVCSGRDDADASARLGVPSGGLAYWVAAIRECFEEAGVLLAHDRDGSVVRFDDPTVAERFSQHRHAVHDGSLRLADLCVAEGVALDAGQIHYVSHWITPVGEKRRFDTRFFVARAPEAQDPLHDDGETIASLWTRPAEAIERYQRRELFLIPPTIANLGFLAGHATADAAIAASAAVGEVPAILPRLRWQDGKMVGVVLPGEPGYDDLAPEPDQHG